MAKKDTNKKPPSFPFYVKDWFLDTSEMTKEEKGYYIDLLCMQWEKHGINSDPNRLANGVGIGLLDVWDNIKEKFELCHDGKLRNQDLEEKRKEKLDYFNIQSVSGKKGALKRWGKNSGANGDPNGDPNGENMPLLSSSSFSLKENNIKEKILKKFGFNEITNFDKLRFIGEFIDCLTAMKKLDYFDEQFDNYFFYKEGTNEMKHGFMNFIGKPEFRYLDGAWNAENWKNKLVAAKKPKKISIKYGTNV